MKCTSHLTLTIHVVSWPSLNCLSCLYRFLTPSLSVSSLPSFSSPFCAGPVQSSLLVVFHSFYFTIPSSCFLSLWLLINPGRMLAYLCHYLSRGFNPKLYILVLDFSIPIPYHYLSISGDKCTSKPSLSYVFFSSPWIFHRDDHAGKSCRLPPPVPNHQAMPVLAPWHLCCSTLKELIADFSSTLLTLTYLISLFYKLCTNDLQESRVGTMGNPVRNHWIPTPSLLMLLTPRGTERACKGEGKDKLWWLKKPKQRTPPCYFPWCHLCYVTKKGPPVYVTAIA